MSIQDFKNCLNHAIDKVVEAAVFTAATNNLNADEAIPVITETLERAYIAAKEAQAHIVA